MDPVSREKGYEIHGRNILHDVTILGHSSQKSPPRSPDSKCLMLIAYAESNGNSSVPIRPVESELMTGGLAMF